MHISHDRCFTGKLVQLQPCLPLRGRWLNFRFQIEAKIVIVTANPGWNLEPMTATGRKISKGIAITFLLLVICVLFAISFLTMENARNVPLNDSDLIYARPDVLDESNAFWTLAKITNELYWPDNQWNKLFDLSANTNWDDAYVADLLRKNRECLNTFDEAMQQPFLLVPEIKTFDASMPYLESWRNFSRLQCICIISLHRANKDQEALALAFEVVNFGQRIENSGGPIISYLTGDGIKSMGLWQIRHIIPDTTLGEANLVRAIHELNDFGPNQEGLTNALKVEYGIQRIYIDNFARGIIPDTDTTNSELKRAMTSQVMKPLLNAKKTKMEIAESDRFYFENMSKPFAELEWPVLPGTGTNVSFVGRVASGNMIGGILYDMLGPSLQSIAISKSKEDVSVKATQLLLALKIYKMRHGKLPDSLSELVPEFLPQVPLDDFDGKPLRYLPERKIIYSVGPCLKDLGGKERQKGSPDYNLPFKIEF
jgi:hypothetical protein